MSTLAFLTGGARMWASTACPGATHLAQVPFHQTAGALHPVAGARFTMLGWRSAFHERGHERCSRCGNWPVQSRVTTAKPSPDAKRAYTREAWCRDLQHPRVFVD